MTVLTAEGTSRTLSTPEGDLHYHEAGEGPPLVLVHGSGPGVSGWANFGENLAAFAASYRCLVVDLPGFGRSYSTAQNPAVHGPDAVITFMDGLGIDRAAIIGNSLGGKISAKVAASHPARVARLVTVGGVGIPFFSPLPSEGIIRLVDFVESPTRERLIEWMHSMVFDPSVLTEEFIEMRWRAATEPAALAGIRQIYSREMLSFLREMMVGNTAEFEMLRKIEAPTLVTWGRDDRVTPLDGAIAPMRMIRKCELHVFYDCGHWSMLERKAEFESVVLSFLGRSPW